MAGRWSKVVSGVKSLFVRVLTGFLGSSFVVSSLLDEHVLEVRSLFVSVLILQANETPRKRRRVAAAAFEV